MWTGTIRFTLFESESGDPPHEWIGEALYPQRWAHRIGLRALDKALADAVADSLSEALGPVSVDPLEVRVVFMTRAPSLPRSEDGAYLVEVSPRKWAAASDERKRGLVLDALATCLARHGVERGRIERAVADTRRLAATTRKAISALSAALRLPRKLRERLSLATWSALAPEARCDAMLGLADAMNAAGYRPVSLGWSRLPSGDLLPTLIDVSAAVELALVPGGAFHPGFSDEQLQTMRSWPGAQHALEALPRRAGKPVKVAPLLMASRCLGADPGPMDVPLRVNRRWLSWADAVATLRRLGYAMPSSAELEWAGRAGRDVLFAWGDDLEPLNRLGGDVAEALAAQYGVATDASEPEEKKRDPLFALVEPNDWGLLEMGAWGTWCLPDWDDAAMPLRTRSGGMERQPSQDPDAPRWDFLIGRGLEHSLDGSHARAALRPVIHLE